MRKYTQKCIVKQYMKIGYNDVNRFGHLWFVFSSFVGTYFIKICC